MVVARRFVRAASTFYPMNINEAEKEAIDLMQNLCSSVGLPRSVAEIYGVLFVAPDPMSIEDFIRKLGTSKGSASQGLRLLRNFGAINPVVLPGDRRIFYKAETNLKRLIPGFIREQIVPQLEGWPQRIQHLMSAAKKCSSKQSDLIMARAHQLDGWARKARQIESLLARVLN